MIGTVLGNGPSRSEFDRVGDYVIACNIPDKEFSVDATVICDIEIVWVLAADPFLVTVPLIISTNVFEKLKELKIVHHYDIIHVFKPKDWYNSAHYAAEFLIEQGCDQINVWGCDAIFEDEISSVTDGYVSKDYMDKSRFIKHWRWVWNDLFDREPAKFRIFVRTK